MKLQFEQITKSYKDKKVLKGISVTMGAGGYGLLGPNGAGKTTMIRIMVDVLRPTEGRILYDGKDIHDVGDEYRAKIGYLPQDVSFYKKENRNEQYDDLVEEIYKLREEKQQILSDKAEMEGVKQSIFNMKAFLNSQTTEIEEYDEQLVRRLIAKVTVFDDKFEVELKSGLSVDIRRSK